MGRVWTLRPVLSTSDRTERPVTARARSARIWLVKDFPSEQEFRTAFKERLVRMRNALGLSQQEMANALLLEGDPETRRNTYSKWEQQKSNRNFPSYLLPRLANVTGHDLWYILTEQSSTNSPKRKRAS